MAPPPTDAQTQIAALLREDWGRLLAILCKATNDLTLAEDCLQDAVLAALEHWPHKGLPDRPDAWLLATARRKALDRFRRDQTITRSEPALALWLEQHQADPTMTAPPALPDHRLELIFACCHPALEEKSRVALTLRALGGLTTDEIAAAFLDKPETMAARLTRAKKKLRAAGIRFRTPEQPDLPERIDGVLKVVYLIFNEGFRASSGPLTRGDLATEAIRLGRILTGLLPDHPEAHGLLALMLLGESRRQARTERGRFVPLERQNRARWDRAQTREGLALVARALTMGAAGPFSIQAAISALHAQAATFEATDWAQIVALYAALFRISPNPVYVVNQAAALSYAKGPVQALALLDGSGAARHLQAYQPYHSCRADLLARSGRPDAAHAAYDRAIALSPSHEERRFLAEKRDALPPE